SRPTSVPGSERSNSRSGGFASCPRTSPLSPAASPPTAARSAATSAWPSRCAAATTFCTHALADLWGYRRAELIGRSWSDTFTPADEAFVAHVREGSINPHEEMFILTRSGERREIAWNNTLLRDDAGRLIGSTSIGEDGTERKRGRRQVRL